MQGGEREGSRMGSVCGTKYLQKMMRKMTIDNQNMGTRHSKHEGMTCTLYKRCMLQCFNSIVCLVFLYFGKKIKEEN